MKDFDKILSANEFDRKWGLYLSSVGRKRVEAKTNNYFENQVNKFNASLNDEQTFQEYHINYVTEGKGILEIGQEAFSLNPGTIIIICSDQQHRYSFKETQGLTTNYIGINGKLANHFFNEIKILNKKCIVENDISAKIVNSFYRIFELGQNQEKGYQQIASGMIIQILAQMVLLKKNDDCYRKQIEKIVQTAQFQMREKIYDNFEPKQLAEDLNMSYSNFRKMFKKHTGESPHQYYLDLKLMRAKELLITTNMSIKEIAYELNFQTVYYFSRIFKRKMNLTPSEVRNPTMVSNLKISA